MSDSQNSQIFSLYLICANFKFEVRISVCRCNFVAVFPINNAFNFLIWISNFSEDPDDDNDGILDVDEDDDDDDDDDDDEDDEL